MPHFKDQNNRLYFLEDSDVAAGWAESLPADCIQITDEEADGIRDSQIPPPSAPSRVPMRKARKMLRSAGLLDGIEAALSAIPGVAGENARDDWEYSSEIDRSNPTFQLLAQGLGLTQQQIDDLMNAADALP